MPRFLASFWPAPPRLELTPTALDDGVSPQWTDGQQFSLSALILRVSVSDFLDEAKLEALRIVLRYWVTVDNYNCDLRRMGLLRFRVPATYRVNEVPSRAAIVEQGMTRPTPEQLARAVRTLFEAADCVGDQLRVQGNRTVAFYAALLLRRLRQSREADLAANPRWQPGLLSALERDVAIGLNGTLGTGFGSSYLFEGLDRVTSLLNSMDLVAAYVNEPKAEPRPTGGA